MHQKWVTRMLAVTMAGGTLFTIHAAAQEAQAPSVAEAARRAKAQKSANAKSTTVITDDTLQRTVPPDPNAPKVTATSQTPDANAVPNAANANAPAETDPAELEKKKTEIATLKQQVADKQNDVELQQRLFTLDSDAYYSKTGYDKDTDGKAKLDAEKAELTQKQEELAKLKAKLTALAPGEPAKPAQPQP